MTSAFQVEISGPGGGRASTRELHTAIFREAVAILEAEYSRDITLEEIAQRVASSPRQVRRVFSEIGATSFRAFLKEVRMRRAAELLMSAEVPVQEIARRVGYHQASAFTRAFGREYGVSPSEFGKTHRYSVRSRRDPDRTG